MLVVVAAQPVVDCGGAARASGGRPWGRKGAVVLGWSREGVRGSIGTGGVPGTRQGGRRRRRVAGVC